MKFGTAVSISLLAAVGLAQATAELTPGLKEVWATLSEAISWQKSEPLMREQERALRPGNSFKECAACPQMVVVPAGTFMMGSPASEDGRLHDEGPRHEVGFARAFAVGRFAVTFGEWDACVADGGCSGYQPLDLRGRGRRPVINVSWDDAKSYVSWLDRKTGTAYRLLTEAEREYVARAGTTTAYWWGSSISDDRANYNSNVYHLRRGPVTVDSYRPNPWGLYQVHGNVWEWTEDCYRENYKGAPKDGSAIVGGRCEQRILRGGSWETVGSTLRSAARNSAIHSRRDYTTGFRVARAIAP